MAADEYEGTEERRRTLHPPQCLKAPEQGKA